MKGLFRSYRTKNRTRFSADAQEFFDEVLALNCPLGHLPTELQEAPYDEGLEMFQRSLWKVVGTLVESDPSLTPKQKLVKKYGQEPFRRYSQTARPTASLVPSSVALVTA